MSNMVELLRKVKALADQGAEGEKDNAQAILDRMMKKHGVTEADIEEERRAFAWFRYHDVLERRLLGQIIYMVTGSGAGRAVGAATNRPRRLLGVECTEAEKIEIQLTFDFYAAAMLEETEVFLSAFAAKHNLFPSPDKAKPRDADTLTDEERRNMFRASLMAQGMEHRQFQKTLEG